MTGIHFQTRWNPWKHNIRSCRMHFIRRNINYSSNYGTKLSMIPPLSTFTFHLKSLSMRKPRHTALEI